jgi:predicted Zn-dependent protease
MDQKTRSLWLAFASLACLLAVTLSAADTESAERGEYGRVDLTVKDIHLIETSEEMYGQFERRGLLHSDPELQTWLQEIGARLAPEPTDFYQKYRFNLIHDPSPNAFALPDGQIYVHTGLVSRLQNEAQLASLLAHEINHVAGHHGVLAYRSQRKKAAAGIFFSIAGAAVGGLGEVAGLMVNVGLVSSVYGYSRELEQEADVKGFLSRRRVALDALVGDDDGLDGPVGGKSEFVDTHNTCVAVGLTQGAPVIDDVVLAGAGGLQHRVMTGASRHLGILLQDATGPFKRSERR